jgi:hypothetical protein
MLLDINKLQQNSGSFVGTSGNATLPAATTAGNTLVLFLAQSGGLVTPAGFIARRVLSIGTLVGGIYTKSNVGVESSWAIAPSTSQVCVWAIIEMENLDLDNPLDVVVSAFTTGTASTLTTGVMNTSSTYDAWVLSVHACLDTTSTTPGTWSGHTGGFNEIIEQGGADGSKSIGVSVADQFSLSLAQFQCTATKTAPVGQNAISAAIVLSAASAPRAAEVVACTGFEFGTSAGIATGSAVGILNFEGVTGSPAVVTTTPRNGSYCLELSSSAAAENLLWSRQFNNLVGAQLTGRLSIYFPTSLPGSDVVLYSAEGIGTAAGTNVVVRYINSSQKIGVKVGTGTEVVSDVTVSANVWISIDFRLDGRTTTWKFDWKVVYADGDSPTDQTQATGTGVVVTGGWNLRIGWTASTTATVRYDDVVFSNQGGHFPLGNMKILPITVDTGGTVTVSGSTANFQTFTANGTLAAWNATTARDAIDEVPPTIGATADGFAQVATSTTGYVEVPMTTYDAATAGEVIRGVRMVVCGWAASATAATIGFRAWDGLLEHQLVAGSGDREFDNSTTTPAWSTSMVRGTVRQDWTQAKLDALAFRVGFSNDASPACGIHNIMGELVLRVGEIVRVLSGEDQFFVDWRIDPDSGGVISAIVTVPADRGATYSITVNGTPIVEYVEAGSSAYEIVIGATDIATVTEQSLLPDPA